MKYKILLVDDCETTLEFYIELIQALLHFDIELVTAIDNSTAMTLCNNKIPDLIISDLNRPKGSGLDFIKRMKVDPKLRYIPVIFITGNCTQKQELELYRNWAISVLPKPTPIKLLVDNIHRIFRLKPDTDITLLTLGKESPTLDYKETYDLSDKTNIASLAKDIIGMANTNGGTIIIGVKEIKPGKFELTGISDEIATFFEITRFNNTVNKYLDPIFHIESKIVEYERMQFVFINIPKASEIPILPKKQHQEAKLFLGKYYIRNTSAETAEIKTSEELRSFMHRFNQSTLL